MILSIIVLLDVLAALSALFGLANFFDNAEVVSKIVEEDKSVDDEEEVVPNREFLGRTNNRELLNTTNGKDRSGKIEGDSFFGDSGQSDLIYLMNTTGELMDPGGEVRGQVQKNFGIIWCFYSIRSWCLRRRPLDLASFTFGSDFS